MIVTVADAVHPFESVTITLYVPAARLLAVAPVWEGELFHKYVYGPVPPPAVTVAEPVLAPLQNTFTEEEIVAVNTAGCVMANVLMI